MPGARHKRAQARGGELRKNKVRLEEAQRIAHVGWWERDFSTGHVTLSDEVCRIFGLQPVDLPEWHQRWLQLIYPEDRARVGEAAAAQCRAAVHVTTLSTAWSVGMAVSEQFTVRET